VSKRVIAYVDGFNLYHGLQGLSRRRDLWLDIAGMLRRNFVDPARDEQLVAVHYFTAAVRGPGWARQDTYLRALQAHSPELTVHLGRYMPKTATCKKCGATWTTYEEKESDVALAVQIVQDAGLGAYDQALVVSADSDMCPAIRAAKTVARARDIVAVFPPKRSSMDVRNTADRTLKIFEKVPRRHQLPPVVVAPDGTKYTRPPYWV
jgi:uncharacterized LabA/DUF88 family protein